LGGPSDIGLGKAPSRPPVAPGDADPFADLDLTGGEPTALPAGSGAGAEDDLFSSTDGGRNSVRSTAQVSDLAAAIDEFLSDDQNHTPTDGDARIAGLGPMLGLDDASTGELAPSPIEDEELALVDAPVFADSLPLGGPGTEGIPTVRDEFEPSIEIRRDPLEMPVELSRPVSAAIPPGLEEELEEVDFFMAQGLGDEARTLIDELEGRYGRHPLITAKRTALDSSSAEEVIPEPAEELIPEAVEEVVHAPAETAASKAIALASIELEGEEAPSPPLAPAPPPSGIPEAVDEHGRAHKSVPWDLNAPQRVVAKGMEDEDYDAHYDLGIAYQGMGLYDQAITELRTALRGPSRKAQCYLFIGQCYLEQGQVNEAIAELKHGLNAEGRSPQDEITFLYELGAAYERQGVPVEALYYFDRLAKRSPGFRDVKARMDAVRPAAEAAAQAALAAETGGKASTRSH
jgi:tetratricopeptide (TPR) repeat protein